MATIRWVGADRIRRQAPGSVCDLSISGVYLETSAELRLTQIVRLEMTPPDMPRYGPEMRFEGRVVRTEKRLGRLGYAVAGRLYLC